ncbi:hypothetical protein BGZ63DRAFT_426080 [Mariannaea sp. PMI_226]|nr:hypothetical protein BGZ63DRAFT_426080 [Mariannaea sp. PMI_226]
MSASHLQKPSSIDLVVHYGSSIKDKTILTTGVSPSSIGAAFVQALAVAKPALLIFAGRCVLKLQQTADELTNKNPDIRIRLLKMDLESLSDVKRAAEEVLAWDDVPKIDVLVTSAGIMAKPYACSLDGYESHFTVNHLGHFLFTNLIMDKLLASTAPRVVSVTSTGHRLSPIRWGDINFDNGTSYDKWAAYGQSKTANMLFAVSLAEKLGKRGLVACSVHPGSILNTGLTAHINFDTDVKSMIIRDRALGNPQGWNRDVNLVSTDQGAAMYVFGSFEPSIRDQNGAYFLECRLGDPCVDTILPWATSPVEAERLWHLSEKIVGQKFLY